ncbi:MAG: exosortase [Pseudomonadota bacterium]
MSVDDASSLSRRQLSHKEGAVCVALLALGWAALYAPVYFEFAQTAWRREENGHVLFIMAICAGAAWARISEGRFSPASSGELFAGAGVMAIGLLVYGVGRLGEIDLFSSASQLAVAFGAVLALTGWNGLKRLWFPVGMLAYVIIWPGWAIDTLTAPLKLFVAEIVSQSLFAAGLPVAHSGAVISAGSYELLVVEACAGLNSLIALTAVGAVYLYVAKRQSFTVNLAVLLSLIPIAILANLARVAILVLITYYWGYDAGQSFLHEMAGLVMFAVALAAVFVIDALAALIWERRS